jgi:hypothetical protein
MMNNECGLVGIRTDKGNQSAWRKPAPVPCSPSQVPHSMTWDRTWADVVIVFELKIPWHIKEGWLI